MKRNDYYIDNKTFQKLVNQGWEIIDVRSPNERKFLRVIPESKNIPYPKVIQEMQTLYPDQQAKLIMVCNAGNRSGLSAKAYRDRGYENVYVLADGIEGLPPEVFKTKN